VVDVIAFNGEAEAAFVALVRRLVIPNGRRWSEVIQEAAYELDISTETAKRYLVKHTASRAEFVVERGFVRLRLPSEKAASEGSGGE